MLRRGRPLTRRTRLQASGAARRQPMKRRPPRRAQDGRDADYMAWVRTLPCLLADVDRCDGDVEAHHAGINHGLARKDDDRTCVPLCTRHHRCWHDASGPFRSFDRGERRAWAAAAIAATQKRHHRAEVMGVGL